jgi:hypothetical protein
MVYQIGTALSRDPFHSSHYYKGTNGKPCTGLLDLGNIAREQLNYRSGAASFIILDSSKYSH